MKTVAAISVILVSLLCIQDVNGNAVKCQSSLMAKLHEVDKLRQAGETSQFLVELKEWRNEIKEFTITRSGKDLNLINWGVPFRTCYEWTDTYECKNYQEAEQVIRDALEILQSAEPESWRLPLSISIHLVVMHGHYWGQKRPRECAELIDELEERVSMHNDAQLKRDWDFLVPILESSFLSYSRVLPLEERKTFYKERENKLRTYLLDESIQLEWRTRYLWWWSADLERLGRMEESAAILNAWWSRYNDNITLAAYYDLTLWVAMFGEGDQEKASRILKRATTLQTKWKKPSEIRHFMNMVKTYYDYMMMPSYELKRQHNILIAKQKKEE